MSAIRTLSTVTLLAVVPTDIGRIIMAAFVDGHDKLVARSGRP